MDAMTLHRKSRLQALVDAPPYRGLQRSFCEAAKMSEGRLSQLLGPVEPFGERAAKNLAQALGLPERFFEDGFTEFEPPPGRGAQAHTLSHLTPIVDPQTVTWEWILSAKKLDLPWRFMVLMPDASLSGKFEKGAELVFQVDYPPRVGRPVLVEHRATGKRYVRLYAEGASGWRALATSPVHLSFEQGAEEVDILAALRWSD